MNTEDTNKGGTFSKITTFIGLIGILIFLAWSAIQIVKLFPSALNSLASLADSVYDYKPSEKSQEKITINSDRAIMNSGETLTIWWENKKNSGTYTFNYPCIEGVALDIRSASKDFSSISCNDNYDLGLIDRIEIRIDSEKARFAEVSYSIAYFEKNRENKNFAEAKTISVINSEIPEKTAGANSEEKDGALEKPTEVVKPEPNKNIPAKPITKPTASQPTYIYKIPVSQPNGYTDLVLSNLKIGTKSSSGIFVDTNSITKNKAGAIEFAVHNIGNKTSSDWIFEAKLPGNVNYTSNKQLPLKPNERAVLTVSFPTTKDIDLQKINVLIKTASDKNKSTNYLEKTVVVLQ